MRRDYFLIIISGLILILFTTMNISGDDSESKYVNESVCAKCHIFQAEIYKETDHADSYEGLIEMGEENTPECLECHTTGYEDGGFTSVDETPEFKNVGCQGCHGPCGEHISADVEERALYHTDARKSCIVCHTEDSDHGFEFKTKWEKIKH